MDTSQQGGIASQTNGKHVRVAAVQCSSRMGTKAAVEANAAKMEKLAREAAAGGAQIIVFPEACLTGYTSQAFLHNWHVEGRRLAPRFAGVSPAGIVPQVASPEVQHLVALAGELRVYMSIPFVEEAANAEKVKDEDLEDGLSPATHHSYYNSIVLASPAGEIAAHYRKTHLWGYVDDSWATAGTKAAVVETEFGRVGLGICYDIHRLHDLYASQPSLWTLLYSVAWVGDRTDGPTERWFREDLPSTYFGRDALQCNVIAANWSTDKEYVWDGAGHSSIYAANGDRLAFLATTCGDEILYSDLPVAQSALDPTKAAPPAESDVV